MQLEVILAAQALNLGRSWWTVASQMATLANFYLTTWEEYHTGQLYLAAFSGPVEGILLIVGIYVISGIYGPQFWDVGILTFTRLDRIPFLEQNIPNIGLNESFMVFGAFGVAFNIASRFVIRTLFSLDPLINFDGVQLCERMACNPLCQQIHDSTLARPASIRLLRSPASDLAGFSFVLQFRHHPFSHIRPLPMCLGLTVCPYRWTYDSSSCNQF